MLTEIDRKKRVVQVAVMLIMAITCGAWGRVIYVDNDATSPGDGSSWQTAYKFLQDALADAETADKPVEIRVAQGIYQPDRSSKFPGGTQNREATFHLIDEVSIRGGFAGSAAPDPNARDVELYRTVLSGDLAQNDAQLTNPLDARDDASRQDNSYHVVAFNEERRTRGGLTAELDGLVIVSGHAFRYRSSGSVPTIATPDDHAGGGLFVANFPGLNPQPVTVELTIRDCVFDDNYAEETGGAVYCLNVQGLKVICCQFTGNGTYKWGGALCLPGRAVEMIDCRIQRNHSNAEAGGIWFSGQELTLRRCTFMENRASMYAGGMHIGTGERTVVRCFDCIWRDNAALAYRGGGIYIFGGITFEAARCRFIGNWTGKRGGAIANSAMNSLLRLSNCLLCGNRAGEGGAVFSNSHGAIHVMSCSAWANRAPKGAFLFDHTQDANYSSAEIRNCVVSNGESEIWNDRGAITVRYTDMPNGYAAVHDPRGLAVWGPGNIEADPCFVAPGYWDPNGTPGDPNDDFFIEGDYHLKSQAGRWDPISESWVRDDVTSPCIDAGDPNSPIGQEPFPNGGRINMGVYGGTAEASRSYFGGPVCETIMAGDINGDCRVDFRDLALVLEHWLWNGVQKRE